MNNPIILTHIASRTLNLLERKNISVAQPSRPVFYAWPREDRVILLVDPEMIKNQQRILSDDFRHDLSTVLNGRKVTLTNSRGIFIQVAWMPPPASKRLSSETLDLANQAYPLAVPIGMTKNGAMWLGLPEMDAVLIGGARRMGKTRLIHGWIQALLRGGQAILYLYDGKGGMEFGRYQASEGVKVVSSLRGALIELQTEMAQRGEAMKNAGVSSAAEYNQNTEVEKFKALVLIIDEVAHIPEDCQGLVGELVGKGGAYGVYPILATTYPGHKQVQSLTRANLSTRICFPVPTQAESRVVLGQAGAEVLSKTKGRMLLVWEARLIEAQAFNVDLPQLNQAYLGPALTEKEQDYVKQAMKNNGLISVNLLTQWDREQTEWSARRLLGMWEARGWVEKDAREKNSRRLTPLLLYVLTQTQQTAQTPQTTQTGDDDENPA